MKISILHFPAEMVIARVDKEDDKTITISRPTFAILDPMQGGVALIEPIWSIGSTSDEFTFNKNQILQILECQKQLEDAYLKATTKIDIPTTQQGGPKLIK